MSDQPTNTSATHSGAAKKGGIPIKEREYNVVLNDGAGGTLVIESVQKVGRTTQFLVAEDPAKLMEQFCADDKITKYLERILEHTPEGYTISRLMFLRYRMLFLFRNYLQITLFMDQHSPKDVARACYGQRMRQFVQKWKAQQPEWASDLRKFRRIMTVSDFEAAINRAPPVWTDMFYDFKKITRDWKKQPDCVINEAAEEYFAKNRETGEPFSEFAARWWARRRGLLQLKELEFVAEKQCVSAFLHYFVEPNKN